MSSAEHPDRRPDASSRSRGHSHQHAHQHGHGSARASARHAGSLRISFTLVVGFLVVQVVVGFATGSLAVLSDAGHMATDALGLGMALAAIGAANRAANAAANGPRTFGLYRLEILAALANAVLLFAVAGYVLVEAARRLSDPPDVASLPVLAVGVLGLAINVIALVLLRGGAEASLNVRGAYLEVVSDALGSLGVIVAAVVMGATGWGWVDPVVASAIGLFILPRAWRLGRDALRVLVQAAPAGIEIDDVRAVLAGIDGVTDVHNLHVWTLTSEMDVVTAHLVLGEGRSAQPVLDVARRLLQERFDLGHATLQVETGPAHDCTEITW
ncbi:MAG: cation diffusion facilitator family transporter [Acidimicrobiia bacterium]